MSPEGFMTEEFQDTKKRNNPDIYLTLLKRWWEPTGIFSKNAGFTSIKFETRFFQTTIPLTEVISKCTYNNTHIVPWISFVFTGKDRHADKNCCVIFSLINLHVLRIFCPGFAQRLARYTQMKSASLVIVKTSVAKEKPPPPESGSTFC